MIVETATVQSVHETSVKVITVKQSGCGQCKSSTACSTSLLGNYFGNKEMELLLKTDLQLQVGDSVRVGLDEKIFMRLTLIMYVLPLAALFFFAFTGRLIETYFGFEHELMSIGLGIVGFVGCLFILGVCKTSWLNPQKFNPVILKKV